MGPAAAFRSGYTSHSLYGNRMDVGWRKTPLSSCFLSLSIYACAFAFSVFAPGNTVHNPQSPSQPNVVSSLLCAIAKATLWCRAEILMFTILIHFLARLAKASHFLGFLIHGFICSSLSYFIAPSFFQTAMPWEPKEQTESQNVYFYVHLVDDLLQYLLIFLVLFSAERLIWNHKRCYCKLDRGNQTET